MGLTEPLNARQSRYPAVSCRRYNMGWALSVVILRPMLQSCDNRVRRKK